MEPRLCVGIDAGCKAHRVGIAHPDGSILEEFDISHNDVGFQEFFHRVEVHRQRMNLPVAVATVGKTEPPEFLSVEWILSQFNQDPVRARAAYRRFVKEGRGVPVWEDVRGGILLGAEEFVGRMGPLLRETPPDTEISRQHRFADHRSLKDIFAGVEGDRRLRDRRIHEAVMEHGHTLTALQGHLGLHPSTLSQIVKRIDEEKRNARSKVCPSLDSSA